MAENRGRVAGSSRRKSPDTARSSAPAISHACDTNLAEEPATIGFGEFVRLIRYALVVIDNRPRRASALTPPSNAVASDNDSARPSSRYRPGEGGSNPCEPGCVD